jgi:hypothetical protein
MTILLETGFRVSKRGPRNRRSLGFARDDKKEWVLVKRGLLLKEGAVR